MSCMIPNKTEEVKTAFRNDKLDYEEMRQRLIETESKLQSLNKLEAEIPDQTFSARGLRDRDYHIEDLEREDLESVPSAISTVPGSYTGFAVSHMPSSTPSRFEMNKSQNNRATVYSGFESDSSTGSIVSHSKYDLKLLKQNQRLLSEVERLVGEIHTVNQKNTDLTKDADRRKTVAELEDKYASLLAENNSQDKALREAERHLDEGQRRIAELQKRLSGTEVELVDVKAELHDIKMVKKEVGCQRDEALHNLNETQDSLEDYQKKTKEKIRRMEEKEDELREALSLSNQERDDLLDQLSSMEMSLASQEAQINRLLNDVNNEDARAREMELANQQLKAQLDLMTAQISDFEKNAKEAKGVKKERDFLQEELKEHRLMAQDLKALLRLLQNPNTASTADDSGNFSVKSWPMEWGIGDGKQEGGLLAVELNRNNNGLGAGGPKAGGGCGPGCAPGSGEGSGNMVCEMRNLVTNMDSEIQRLRADLKQRDADDRTYSNLRDELKALMDKVESGMSQRRELECRMAACETDKSNIMAKLEETLRCLEERDRTLQCVETRLNERSMQIVCLQEDIDDRNMRINSLEQQLLEMQKKRKGGGGPDGQEHDDRYGEALARIKELESMLLCKNKSIEELQEKQVKQMKELRMTKAESEQKIDCLNLSIQNNQEVIQRMKDEGDALKQKVASISKIVDELRKVNRTKDEKLSCCTEELAEVKYAKEASERMLNGQLKDTTNRLKSCQDQCQGLEKALAMCQKEVSDHLRKMDEIRATYDKELGLRDTCIRKLKEDLRHTVEELKCKMEDNNSLEHSLAELRSRLQQLCGQLKESDNKIHCLNIKNQEMEKLMLKDKTACMKEAEDVQRRLQQTCNSLAVANKEIDSQRKELQDKTSKMDCLQSEKATLVQELKKACDKASCLQEKLNKMEKDNQELCRQLQQKMECIQDMENLIRVKEQELKCLTKYLQELKNTEASDNASQSLQKDLEQLKEQLNKCREENKCKVTMLCECEESFKRCQMMCADKDGEIQMLKCQINTLNTKLAERISRVEELERGIENLHKDVERRMMRVDEQLKKYESELMSRMQEIANLKERVNTSQLNLAEKMNELQQQEQKTHRTTGELKSMGLKLKDAEDTRDRLSSQMASKKSEVAELTQQLRLNREQMQKQHEDLVKSRQSLLCVQREGDKLRRDFDDCKANLEHRDSELALLSTERKCLTEKLAQLSCQLEQETAMLQGQLNETKCRMEKEMECIRNYSCQLEATNSNLSQQLSQTQREMMQMERCFHQKLDNLSRDLEDLSTKLSLRDDELSSCKDCIALKDSEIGRLKARLCNCSKQSSDDCKGNKNKHNNNSLDNGAPNDHYGRKEVEQHRGVSYDHYQQDDIIMESKSHINLPEDCGEEFVSGNKSHNSGKDGLFPEDSDESPPQGRISSSSDASTRNSLGVTEVQERLRSNQLRQKEIERQLLSLEEVTQESLGGRQDEEEKEVP